MPNAAYKCVGGAPDPQNSLTGTGDPLPKNLDYDQQGKYEVTGLAPATNYCFTMRSYVYHGDWTDAFTGAEPAPTFSTCSPEMCAKTTTSDPKPAPKQAPEKVLVPTPEGTETTPVGGSATSASSLASASNLARVAQFPVLAQARPDLEAVQIAGFTNVSSGDNAVYTATIRNNGSAASGNVEVVIGMSGALQAWDPIVQGQSA